MFTSDSFTGDLRYTFRAMRRDAGFCAIAVLILGLGIGASTAIFSVVNPLLFRPLPFRDPGRLVWIANDLPAIGLSGVTTKIANFQDWRNLNHSFEDLTAYFAFSDYGSYILSGTGEPERLQGFAVVQNFFGVMGVHPEIGRTFDDEECKFNGRKAIILSHGLWERRFASDPRVVGRTVIINDRPTTIVGVMPREFSFGSIFTPGTNVDLFEPFPVAPETDRWGNTLAVIGRLKPGVPLARAQAEFDLLNAQMRTAHPDRFHFGARLTNLQDQLNGRFRGGLVALLCAVGAVLLIACANLSNLLLARAASRRKEIAVRTALGAGRARLIRQMLTESGVLSCCGAAVGLLLAVFATRAMAGMHGVGIPMLQTAHVDGTALAFTVVIAIATGLLFGIAPALQISGTGAHEALKDASRGSTEARGGAWVRRALVVSEVALACTLLVSAGLLIRSFLRVLDVDLGFQPAQTAVWHIQPGQKYANDAQKVALYQAIERGLASLPGVESSGVTDALPLGRNRSWGVFPVGRTYDRGQAPIAFPRIVDAGYIATMKIPVRAGRNLSERDTAASELVMVINENMARALWPGTSAIDQKANVSGRQLRVAGVVSNVRHSSLEEAAGMEMYLPITQWSAGDVELVVRTKLQPETIAPSIRTALKSIDSSLPTAEFQTLGDVVDHAVSPRRFVMLLLGSFALLALLLASLGIYGLVSYSVSQRTPEIGIRMALGATAANVQLSVIRQTLLLAITGTLLGAIGSLAAARLLASQLFGVTGADPLTFAAMTAMLTATAVLAGYVPARRASRIDPMAALRSE